MPLNLWVILSFLLGAAVGALVVSIHRVSTISRIREQFQAELDSLVEARLKATPQAEESPIHAKNGPGQAA
jgi:hypothetical protein